MQAEAVLQPASHVGVFQSILKVFYVKLYVNSLVDKPKWFYKNARYYDKIYMYELPLVSSPF